MDDWSSPTQVIVSEHSSQHDAEQKARDLDWGKDISDRNWHHVKKVTKSVYYS